jgi:hypothetical protein
LKLQRMRAELRDLRDGMEMVEERARSEIGDGQTQRTLCPNRQVRRPWTLFCSG